MESAFLLLVAAPYAAVGVGYVEARRRGEPPPRWARRLGILAAALHLAALVALGARTGRSPFQTGAQALLFLSCSIAAIYVLLEATSGVRSYGGGFYLLAAAVAAAGSPSFAQAMGSVPPARVKDPILSLHVGLALLGTAALAAGGLMALGYLGAYRRVKDREIDLDRADGPSLFGLQALARHASVTGLLFLGPSLVFGAMVAARGGVPVAAARGEFAVAALEFALVACAAFLWWRRPRRGPVAAWLNVAATVVAIVGFSVVHPLLVSAGG